MLTFLAERGGYDPTLPFPKLAQMYEEDQGFNALVQFVRDRLELLGDAPQGPHRLIARLKQCKVLVTTALNSRLERAFEEAGRRLQKIVRDDDVPFQDSQSAQLYKLRGELDRAESLVLTEEQHNAFFDEQDTIALSLQAELASKTVLFIGYDLDDGYFQRLYRKVIRPLDKMARHAYAFGETPGDRVARWCKRNNINVVPADATTFLQALLDQLEDRARPPAPVPADADAPPAPLPERPYKLLDYYEASDQAIFFGRQRQIQELSGHII